MKPIEPGCLCLSYAPGYQGQCTALSFHAKGEAFRHTAFKGLGAFGEDVWECQFDGITAFLPARMLVRIDDGGDAESDESRAETRREVPA